MYGIAAIGGARNCKLARQKQRWASIRSIIVISVL